MGQSTILKDRQVLYRGDRISLELHHIERDIDGKRFKREVVVHPGSVVILPMLNDSTVLLIRNRRYAIGNVDLFELPAGTLEKGEAPLNCAGRELQEETGHLAGRIKPLIDMYPSPGILSEKMYCYVAYDLKKTAMNLDEGEEIDVFPTPYDEVIRMIGTHQIIDAKTVAVILFYDRFLRVK
jgi:ADP-ribose pyrophosphatase